MFNKKKLSSRNPDPFSKAFLNQTDSQIIECAKDCDCVCPCDCRSINDDEKGIIFSRPLSYYIELTTQCNNSCLGCGNVFLDYHYPYISKQTLNFCQWEEIIDHIAPYTQNIKVTGGEPTIFSEFDSFVQLLDSYRINYSVFSNARWNDTPSILACLGQSSYFKGFLLW